MRGPRSSPLPRAAALSSTGRSLSRPGGCSRNSSGQQPSHHRHIHWRIVVERPMSRGRAVPEPRNSSIGEHNATSACRPDPVEAQLASLPAVSVQTGSGSRAIPGHSAALKRAIRDLMRVVANHTRLQPAKPRQNHCGPRGLRRGLGDAQMKPPTSRSGCCSLKLRQVIQSVVSPRTWVPCAVRAERGRTAMRTSRCCSDYSSDRRC